MATELQCAPVTLADGRTAEPSQCSSVYIFPGIGMGTLISGCTKLRDEQFIAAAEAVARLVTPEDLARGAIYPPMSAVREVAASVAQAVALKAYQARLPLCVSSSLPATVLPDQCPPCSRPIRGIPLFEPSPPCQPPPPSLPGLSRPTAPLPSQGLSGASPCHSAVPPCTHPPASPAYTAVPAALPSPWRYSAWTQPSVP